MQNPQKRFSFAILSVIVISHVSGCSCKNAAEATPDGGKNEIIDNKQCKENLVEEYERRDRLTKQLLGDASWLAIQTDDQEAKEISDYLNNNLYTVMNVGSRFIGFDDPAGNQPIPLLFIFGNEMDESPNLTELVPNIPAFAWVMPTQPTPIMMIKDSHLSRFANALIVLHEGNHAKHFYSLPKDSPYPTTLEFAEEEVRVYEFQFRLADKVGGEKFTDLVNEQVELYKIPDLKMTDDENVKLQKKQLAIINDIFKDRGEVEQWLLYTQFLLEAKFRYIDEILPNDEKSANEIKTKVYLEMVNKGLKK